LTKNLPYQTLEGALKVMFCCEPQDVYGKIHNVVIEDIAQSPRTPVTADFLKAALLDCSSEKVLLNFCPRRKQEEQDHGKFRHIGFISQS